MRAHRTHDVAAAVEEEQGPVVGDAGCRDPFSADVTDRDALGVDVRGNREVGRELVVRGADAFDGAAGLNVLHPRRHKANNLIELRAGGHRVPPRSRL